MTRLEINVERFGEVFERVYRKSIDFKQFQNTEEDWMDFCESLFYVIISELKYKDYYKDITPDQYLAFTDNCIRKCIPFTQYNMFPTEQKLNAVIADYLCIVSNDLTEFIESKINIEKTLDNPINIFKKLQKLVDYYKNQVKTEDPQPPVLLIFERAKSNPPSLSPHKPKPPKKSKPAPLSTARPPFIKMQFQCPRAPHITIDHCGTTIVQSPGFSFGDLEVESDILIQTKFN